MKKIFMGVILSLVLILVGCSTTPIVPTSVLTPQEVSPPGIADETPIPTPIPTPSKVPIVEPPKPPDDRTWISPGKVQIGNFHLGARAECEVVVHNGMEEKRKFSISYRKYADYIALPYLMAPPEVVQDWVVVADMTPVLAPRETRSILVSVEMPLQLGEGQALFWNLLDSGKDFLYAERERIYKELVEEELTPKLVMEWGQDKVKAGKVAAEKAQKRSRPTLEGIPELSLLLYFEAKPSVSFSLFSKERPESSQLVLWLLDKGYLAKGNLLVDKWEFWISVYDASQTGKVVTELASKWQVTMRQTG